MEQLLLTHFRRFRTYRLPLGSPQILIVGPNGSGKTSIIEAFSILAFTRSWRTTHEERLVQYGESLARIELSGGTRKLSAVIERTLDRGVKRFFFDTKQIATKQFIGHVKAVLFSPELVEIIRSGPGGRRRTINLLASQWKTDYAALLQRYTKAVTQRNALLSLIQKGLQPVAQLSTWDALVAELGSELATERVQFLQYLEPEFRQLVKAITGHDSELHYLPSGTHSDIPDTHALLGKLMSARERDIRFASTSVGPHRDDLAINVGGKPVLVDGSRGEVRLMALLLAIGAYRKLSAADPTITFLFDDVTSEFDINRLRALREIMPKAMRVVATSTEPSIETLFPAISVISLE